MKVGEPIVILGATSKVAQCVCEKLASDGAELVLVARDQDKLATMSADLKVRGAAKVATVASEVGDTNQHDSLIAHIEHAMHFFLFFGSLPDQPTAEKDAGYAFEGMKVNLLAPLSLLHTVSNRLEELGQGSLVVVSSVAGDRGRASNYWYGTAKGALSIHCQGLRNRLAKSGVSVLTVKPGFIDTPMTAHLPKKPAVLWTSPEAVAEQILKAWQRKRNVVYTPKFWWLIMLIIKSIPELVFKRLSL